MDSLFSFPVGLFHPLQHAGLSRRSTYSRYVVEVKLELDEPAKSTSTTKQLYAINRRCSVISCEIRARAIVILLDSQEITATQPADSS